LWAIKEEILKKWSERKEKKKKTAILHQLSEDSYNSPNDVPETRMREIEERLAREAMMPERFERKARKKIV
jgi:hypothetical protein